MDRSGFFETTLFTTEDSNKALMYTQNAMRAREQNTYDNYHSFLKSLKMKSVIKSFEPIYLQRITQLINKTNQFNLTSKRYSESEIIEIAHSQEYITLCETLSDRFGDNGLVTGIIGRKNRDVLDIELWILSCRVFKRDVELAMLDHLATEARNAGLQQIKGLYYPILKNTMVKKYYETLDFRKTMEDQDGNSEWIFNLINYVEKNEIIQIER